MTPLKESIRQEVLTRDNNTCQRCKISEDALSHSLEIHDKKRRRDGGADIPDNLITYCHRCHKIVEPPIPKGSKGSRKVCMFSLRDELDIALKIIISNNITMRKGLFLNSKSL